MENETNSRNPFHPDNPALFVEREQASALLNQHLAKPAGSGALIFSGRRNIGKSELMRHFAVSAQALILPVLISLDDSTVKSDITLLKTIVELTEDHVVQLGYPLPTWDEIPDDPTAYKQWISVHFLPDLYRAIRSHRRILWLIDNAHLIIDALQDSRISDELPTFLNSLLSPQLAIVMTIDIGYEDQLARLQPLASTLHRLENLRLTDTIRLMAMALGEYGMNETIAEAVYRYTGGEPGLVARFGYHLFELRDETTGAMNMDHLHKASGLVYEEYAHEFSQIWSELTLEERQVVRALASLNYSHPLDAINVQRLEAWLVETDYPMDETAIGAAVRSLEYRQIIAGTGNDLKINARLVQRWVLDNITTTSVPGDPGKIQSGEPNQSPRAFILGITAAAILLVVLILAIALNGDEESSVNPEAVPTVTLVPRE